MVTSNADKITDSGHLIICKCIWTTKTKMGMRVED